MRKPRLWFTHCVFIFAWSAVGQPICAADTQPNILIIYADDMGYGDLAIQNPDSKIPTPNLDALATQSLRFTNGHSSSGICTPSRYALLTGRYHWRKFHGIVNAFGESVFDAERLTLPEMLQAKGYTTAAIGENQTSDQCRFGVSECASKKRMLLNDLLPSLPRFCGGILRGI